MAKKDDRVRKIEALKATLRCIVGRRGKGEVSFAFDFPLRIVRIVRLTEENVGEVAKQLAQ